MKNLRTYLEKGVGLSRTQRMFCNAQKEENLTEERLEEICKDSLEKDKGGGGRKEEEVGISIQIFGSKEMTPFGTMEMTPRASKQSLGGDNWQWRYSS